MRRVESGRGSTFYLCQRSLSDVAYPKYPGIPVTDCRGYELATRVDSSEPRTTALASNPKPENRSTGRHSNS